MSRDTIPVFSDYRGGDCFSFQNKIFHPTKKLGHGSYGEVFCFESEDGAIRYAVKCEKPCAGRYYHGSYFESEAQWCQKMYNLGVLSGNPQDKTMPHFVLMPYFEGKPLNKTCYASVKHIFYDWIWTAAAIQELHQKHQAIHGDLKADNVISGEKVYLIDFGFTTKINFFRKIVFFTEDSSAQYHQAPELFSYAPTKKQAQAAQDIYSLGILLRDLFILFLQDAIEYDVTSKAQFEKVQEIHKKLCDYDPQHRWSIAKAIYMLASLFLISVPYSLWEKKSYVLNEKFQGDATHFMKSINKLTLESAIQIRIDELKKEKRETTCNTISMQIKHKKITGLQGLQIKIANQPSRALQAIYDAKCDPEITQGVFRHKTRDLLDALKPIAAGFQTVH